LSPSTQANTNKPVSTPQTGQASAPVLISRFAFLSVVKADVTLNVGGA
jgi:hypothetical protein